MPTYQYKCPKCGKVVDRYLQMKGIDKVVVKCDKCKCKCKRLIGPGSGIIFRGPGFYVTDYKDKEEGK